MHAEMLMTTMSKNEERKSQIWLTTFKVASDKYNKQEARIASGGEFCCSSCVVFGCLISDHWVLISFYNFYLSAKSGRHYDSRSEGRPRRGAELGQSGSTVTCRQSMNAGVYAMFEMVTFLYNPLLKTSWTNIST